MVQEPTITEGKTPVEYEDDIEYKSKTRKKKDAARLQRLGEDLMAMPAVKIRKMALPEDLKTALLEGQSITSNVAARRHRQYIGVLMRDMDPEEVARAIAITADDVISPAERETREWTEQVICGGQEAAEAFLTAYPDGDRQRLRQLARNAEKERQAGKSTKAAEVLKEMIGSVVRGR